MTKLCCFCDEPFKDGEVISFLADTQYKQIPSKVSYALGSNFTVQELYHKACLDYVMGGGQ